MCIDWSQYFYYDETSPSRLRWAIDRYRGQKYNILTVSAGDKAGSQLHGYWRVEINTGEGRKSYAVHRIIYEMFHNVSLSKEQEIDHVDGDSSNNSISNLRCVTRAVNSRNCKIKFTNSVGVNGVSVHIRKKNGSEYASFKVSLRTLDGKNSTKYFSIDRYGIVVALFMAATYRAKMIEELNTQGAGYTERHGT